MTLREDVARFCFAAERRTVLIIESCKALWIGGIVFLLLFQTLRIALHQRLWFDEILTAYLSRLSFPELLHALKGSADTNPPLLYLPVKLANHLFKSPELATRMPSILFYGIFLYFTYRLVKPYVHPYFAFLAALLPEVSIARLYASEGRSYACVLACMAIALFSWREMCAGHRRLAYAPVLTGSLAIGICSHYSAALIFMVLAAGEATRILNKRFDLLTTSSIIAGALPLIWLRPFVAAVRIYLTAFWSHLTFGQVMWATWYAIVGNVKLVGALAVLAVIFSLLCKPSKVPRPNMPSYELVAWIALLCAPIIGYVQGLLSGGFTIRYALPMVISTAVLSAWILDRLSRSSTLIACIAIALALQHETVADRNRLRIESTESATLADTLSHLSASGQGTEPILVGDPITFSPLFFYSDPHLQARMRYASAPRIAIERTGTDSSDLTLRNLSAFTPVSVIDYSRVQQCRIPAQMLVNKNAFEWLPQQLSADGIPARLEACYAFGCLFEINNTGSTTPLSKPNSVAQSSGASPSGQASCSL